MRRKSSGAGKKALSAQPKSGLFNLTKDGLSGLQRNTQRYRNRSRLYRSLDTAILFGVKCRSVEPKTVEQALKPVANDSLGSEGCLTEY